MTNYYCIKFWESDSEVGPFGSEQCWTARPSMTKICSSPEVAKKWLLDNGYKWDDINETYCCGNFITNVYMYEFLG